MENVGLAQRWPNDGKVVIPSRTIYYNYKPTPLLKLGIKTTSPSKKRKRFAEFNINKVALSNLVGLDLTDEKSSRQGQHQHDHEQKETSGRVSKLRGTTGDSDHSKAIAIARDKNVNMMQRTDSSFSDLSRFGYGDHESMRRRGSQSQSQTRSQSVLSFSNPEAASNLTVSSYPFKRGLTRSRISSTVSVMDERYCEALQRHYRLLMTHIILTDDIIEVMAKEKILPESMIKDIQSAETREERNEQLLNCLRLRGNKSYKQFRELMYRMGNFFVADLMWEEGDGPSLLEEKDLAKFPGLLTSVEHNHRQRLMLYLDSKIREKALLMTWKDNPTERMAALHSKVLDFNQEKMYRDTIAEQEQKLKMVEATLKLEQDTVQELQMEVDTLQQQLTHTKNQHRVALDSQAKIHDENLLSMIQLKENMAKLRLGLCELNELVKLRVEIGADNTASDSILSQEGEASMLPVLERNVRRILTQLRHEKEQNRKWEEQREAVLALLNRRYCNEPLVSVIKDVLKHEQKHRSLVMSDIMRLQETFKQVSSSTSHVSSSDAASMVAANAPLDPAMLDTKNFKNQLALLRAEAEHIHKRFSWKESETELLKSKLDVLLQTTEGKPASSVDSSSTLRSKPAQPPSPSEATASPSLLESPESSIASSEAKTSPVSSKYSATASSKSLMSPKYMATACSKSPTSPKYSATASAKSLTSPPRQVADFQRGSAKARRSLRTREVGKGSSDRDQDQTVIDVDDYMERKEDGAKRRGRGDTNFNSGRYPQ